MNVVKILRWISNGSYFYSLLGMSIGLLSVSAHSDSLTSAKVSLDLRFTYEADKGGKDTWTRLNPIGKVRGDCEDYAMALQSKVGGKLWGVLLPDGVGHVMLCVGLRCADTLNKRVFALNPEDYRWMMVITDEMRDKRLAEGSVSSL